MLADGATHIGVATDHVIESFRNKLWPGYKTSAGMPRELLVQFPLLEEALIALGVKVWPMVDLEADDALASAAAVGDDDPAVDQVAIWTPDKDLGQCVRGARVVQVDRRSGKVIDASGVEAKFGVPPASIPDYLALVGDSADGFPGLQGWGAKSAASVLRRYGHIEAIPDAVAEWDGVNVRSAGTLAATLAGDRKHALLFKDLATLRVERSLLEDVDQLRWTGTTDAFPDVCKRIDAAGLLARARALSTK
jgi:5'-3' exonuclease